MNSESKTLVENLELDMFLDEKIGDHLRWVIDLSDQLLLGKPFEGELDPNKCDFGKWYYAFKSNDPEMMRMHEAIEEPHSKLHHTALKIKRLYEAGEIEEAKRVYVEETQLAVKELESKIAELMDFSMKGVNLAKQEYEVTGNVSQVIVASLVLFFITIGLVTAIFISKGISTPIRKLTDASSIIARGNLDNEIDTNTNDEIGDLAKSFNKMVKDLKDLMKKKNALAAAQAKAEVEKKKTLELRQIYNGSPSGIRVVDTNFNIMSQNEAMIKLSGMDRENIKEMKCYEQLKGTLCGTEHCTLKQILNGKELIDTEIERERVDGKRFPCRVMASPFRDIAGNTIGIIEVFTDITELKETQDKLVRSEKLAVLGKLGGTLGHELRNPLSTIAYSVYFLKMKLWQKENEKIRKHLNILEEEVAISNKIITDILTFCRVKEPQLTKVNIRDVIEGPLTKIHVPDNIEVDMKIKNELSSILADEIQLKQVFSNIILNAIQAMPKGGMLSITGTTKKDRFMEIDISDTGEGIPKENLDKIFEPIFSTKAHGTGLGLCVCQSIIEMHKGKIKIESEPEKGTRFIVQLPITNKTVNSH
jgi:PAS domain S-box-containing protein